MSKKDYAYEQQYTEPASDFISLIRAVIGLDGLKEDTRNNRSRTLETGVLKKKVVTQKIYHAFINKRKSI